MLIGDIDIVIPDKKYWKNAGKEDLYNKGWEFEVDAAESMQIGTYSKGCFYDNHADGNGVTVYDSPENKWLNNKLSIFA